MAAMTAPEASGDDERRERIVEAAEQLFLARGYGATSMEDIAHACGMSKKTLYRYFADKEQLFESVIGRDPGFVPVEVTGDGGGAAKLEDQLTAFASHVLSDRQVRLAKLVITEAGHSPELGAQFLRQNLERAHAIVRQQVTDMAQARNLTAEEQDDHVAMLLGAVIADQLLRALIGQPESDASLASKRRVHGLVEMLLARM